MDIVWRRVRMEVSECSVEIVVMELSEDGGEDGGSGLRVG